MKMLSALLLFGSLAIAQTQSTSPAIAPGCGSDNAKFDVKTDKQKHPTLQPGAGKAMLYFIEDDRNFQSRPSPSTRLGVDGTWIGANHGDSYFYLPVDPGEHHLCAGWQSKVILGKGYEMAAAHFTAEAGKSYYFRVTNNWNHESKFGIEFGPLDVDEALLLMSKFSFSTSQLKK